MRDIPRSIVCVMAAAAIAAAAPLPGREGHADLPGVRIWFTDTGGTGVPVVLLHANTGSSRVWDYQTPAFTARGYRVIAYDRRGFGRSIIDPGGHPARYRCGRSAGAGESSWHRSLPSRRHGGRRIRRVGLCAVVPAAAAQSRGRQQHWRRAGRGLSGVGPPAQAGAAVQRPAAGDPGARAVVPRREPRGDEALGGVGAHEPAGGAGRAGSDDAKSCDLRRVWSRSTRRRCCSPEVPTCSRRRRCSSCFRPGSNDRSRSSSRKPGTRRTGSSRRSSTAPS